MTDLDFLLARSKRKLASRKGKSAYRENVPLLEAEIVRLEQLIASRDSENNHDRGS